MLEILQFIAQDRNHFLGTVILVSVVLGGIAAIVSSFRGCDCEDK